MDSSIIGRNSDPRCRRSANPFGRIAPLLGILLVLTSPGSAAHAGGNPFTRGDVNADASVDIADAIFLLGVLFLPGAPPIACEGVADANDDGTVNIADAISILSFLFDPSAPPLPEPSPTSPPGYDPTPTDPFPCGDEPIGPPPPGGLIRLAAGNDSMAPDGDYVLASDAEWSNFWNQHAGGGTPPPVDFTSDLVIAVVIGYFNGTHCSEIASASPSGDIQVRHYHWQLPCAPGIAPTVVYDIVVWENAQQVPLPLTFDATDVDTCPLPCP
jgi:hypothetical protein